MVQADGHDRGAWYSRAGSDAPAAEVVIAVRPEWQHLAPPGGVPPGDNALAGRIRDVLFLGDVLQVLVSLDGGGEARVALRNEGATMAPSWKIGDVVGCCWRAADGQVLA